MVFFKKGELNFLWPFYFEFFFARILSLMAPFFIIYLTNLGFSLTKVGIVLATISATILIFEIPTGAIADVFGRKFSVLLGYALEGICVLSLYFFTSYYAILAISSLLGIAMTLSSGAKDAWTTDLIKKENKSLLNDFFANSAMFMSFSMFFAGLLGAFLVKNFGISIIFIATSLSFFVSIIVLIPAKEIFKKRKVHIKKSLSKLIHQSKESIKYSHKNKSLALLLAATGAISAIFVLNGSLSWTPLLLEHGLKFEYFGYLWSAMGLITLIASYTSKKLLRKNREKEFMLKSLMFFSIGSISVIFFKSLIPLIIILMIVIFFQDIQWPVSRVFFHKLVPNKLRATIGSIESMIISLAGIMVPPLTGYLIDIAGTSKTIVLAGIVTIIPITLIKKIGKKKL